NLNWRINQTLHGKIFVAYTCELINVVPLRKKFCVMVLILSTQLLLHLITVTDINAKGKLKAYRNRKLLTYMCSFLQCVAMKSCLEKLRKCPDIMPKLLIFIKV
ncbi:hypothetical protein E2I00_001432, partial [Balaenoptera physalus]